MKNDFRKMEDEMDHLATNMASITDFSKPICYLHVTAISEEEHRLFMDKREIQT
jgi:hypothetical protein